MNAAGKIAVCGLVAAMLSIGSIAVRDNTSEMAVYNSEAELKDAVRGRLVAGWPAPFIADFPQISVQDKIGPEDVFRPGPATATFAFWYLIAALLVAAAARTPPRRALKRRRKRPSRSAAAATGDPAA